MRVTFLAHSGFFLELETASLLFDWWKGELPPLPADRPLLSFASHRHEDHFNPAIFSLAEGGRDVRFLLGKDIRLTERNRARWDLSDDAAARCLALGGGETVSPIPGVTVETLPSTDEGVAFLVSLEGKTLFHAGDLNWWHWEGEDKAWNRNMEVNFKRYCEPLRGRHIDLAMFPIDPRLGEDGFRGARYFLELTDTACLLPMHQWEQFSFTQDFLAACPAFAGQVRMVERNGQCFTL